MVKAKFGALALTVLMGLGAVSPLHGVTEAHALNAPVANSAQQKTVVSTTDDSDGVMSYKDKESGKTFVSEDNGASWMSEEDYNNSHPAINYEWWTYDEYKKIKKNTSVTWWGMAVQNVFRNWKKGLIVMLSIALSMVVVNCIVMLVQGYDFDSYRKVVLASDFQLDQMTDTLSNTNFNGINHHVLL